MARRSRTGHGGIAAGERQYRGADPDLWRQERFQIDVGSPQPRLMGTEGRTQGDTDHERPRPRNRTRCAQSRLRRAQARAALMVTQGYMQRHAERFSYDGAAAGRRANGWIAPSTDANVELMDRWCGYAIAVATSSGTIRMPARRSRSSWQHGRNRDRSAGEDRQCRPRQDYRRGVALLRRGL